MKKFWNWIKDSDETRTLRLEGPIDEESFWGDEITPQMFRDELNAGEGDVTVWINSPGGNVFAAAEIYTMLKDYKGSITVKIDAIAASAASVVAMAGDTVQMSPVAMLMIHDPSKQARAIEATLDGITPFNAGKKKEEALSLLKKWFPQMENFSGQLKKYKVTINDLLAENEQLEARAKASEKGKMKDTMERAKLESELHDIQRLVDRIPPEVLAELKHQQRHTRER